MAPSAQLLALLQPHIQNAACQALLTVAAEHLPAAIFNHSVRVYLLAKWLQTREASASKESQSTNSAVPFHLPFDETQLFAACIGHDLGASTHFNGPERFEVAGADATCDLLHQHAPELSPAARHQVWSAIALHTSAGIAERIDSFTRLVRLAVKLDFSPALREQLGAVRFAEELERGEGLLPRLEIEKVLGDAVVAQAEVSSAEGEGVGWPPDTLKHPKASWPGILLRSHLENVQWEGVNRAF